MKIRKVAYLNFNASAMNFNSLLHHDNRTHKQLGPLKSPVLF